jgi:hypothetical protein
MTTTHNVEYAAKPHIRLATFGKKFWVGFVYQDRSPLKADGDGSIVYSFKCDTSGQVLRALARCTVFRGRS